MRFLTAGESHGPLLTGILEGIPAGLLLTTADVDADLMRRQQGYGRGSRMSIEKDHVRFAAGVVAGQTTGSPIALLVEKRNPQLAKEFTLPVASGVVAGGSLMGVALVFWANGGSIFSKLLGG